jgi:hypothetical protein
MTTAASDDYGAGIALALGGFENNPEHNVTTLEASLPAVQNKRGSDYTDGLETSKRQRKPRARGKEREGDMF